MKIQSTTTQIKNKSQSSSNCSSPAFGTKFIIKKEAADVFLAKAKAFSAADQKHSHYLSKLIIEEPVKFLQKLAREIIVHNKKAENHLVYPETREIKKFDIKYPKETLGFNNFFKPDKTPSNVKNISLLDSQDSEKLYKALHGEIDFDYHLTLDDGKEFVFPANKFLRSSSMNNPSSHNAPEIMQREIIKDKNLSPKSAINDLNFLFAKVNETGK